MNANTFPATNFTGRGAQGIFNLVKIKKKEKRWNGKWSTALPIIILVVDSLAAVVWVVLAMLFSPQGGLYEGGCRSYSEATGEFKRCVFYFLSFSNRMLAIIEILRCAALLVYVHLCVRSVDRKSRVRNLPSYSFLFSGPNHEIMDTLYPLKYTIYYNNLERYLYQFDVEDNRLILWVNFSSGTL